MKNTQKIKYTGICLIILGVMIGSIPVTAQGCGKYVLDGSMDDWGLDLANNDWSKNSTWLPGSGISFVVEDNNDPRYNTSNPGVHIKGAGSSYTAYEEPMVQHKDGYDVMEPYGSDYFDLEAMYFDQDDDCIYVAIITGEDPDALGDARPGDLALNLDRDPNTGEYGFEYGVKLGTKTGLQQFSLYDGIDWDVPYYIPLNNPNLILSGNKVGDVTGAYVDSFISDNGHTNYVIELAIPKSLVGVTSPASIYDLYLSEGCGNDSIPGASEFPFILSLAMLLVSPAFAYLIIKRNH